MVRFLLLVLFILFNAPSHSLRSSLLIRGGDTAVADAFGRTVPDYLQPSQRFTVEQQVSNTRFYLANFGSTPDRSFPILEQIATGQCTFDHPSDPIAALVQTYHPSPDRELLVPNQAGLDPVGELRMQQVGLIMRHIAIFT